MTVAIAHAAPTAPAPIIPIFMMGPRLRSEFSTRAIGKTACRGVEISSMATTHDQPLTISCAEAYAISYRERFE